ncbi:MAG: hypothetical protein WCR52_23415 [Bacteroidota bacterium]
MIRTAIATICFFALFSINLSAQKTNVWNGGFPGHENDWHFSKNWSLGKTPDVFDNVVIPDVSTTTRRYPVLASGEVEIASLYVQNGATITLMQPARISVENFNCEGTCKGCDLRILVEGAKTTATALRQ